MPTTRKANMVKFRNNENLCREKIYSIIYSGFSLKDIELRPS